MSGLVERAKRWLRPVGGLPPVTDAAAASSSYDTLLLEGGAVKGVTYAGAAHALERSGLLAGIDRFAGSSAGAMAAAALCAGCSAEDVTRALLDIEFSALLDADTYEVPPAVRRIVEATSVAEAVQRMTQLLFEAVKKADAEDEDGAPGSLDEEGWSVSDPVDVLRRLTTEFGLFRGQVIEDRMEALLLGATGRARITFAQLNEVTGGGKQLRVTATSITRQRVAYFDATTTPHVAVATAVRASSAVPFLFAPVTIDGELFVDGGALKNMPLDAFPPSNHHHHHHHRHHHHHHPHPHPHPHPHHAEKENPGGFRGRTLALSIRSPTVAEESGAVEVTSMATYAAALLETMTWGHGSANCLGRASEMPGVDLVELGAHKARRRHFSQMALLPEFGGCESEGF